MWITHLMCDIQSPVAPELAFGPMYRERLKANEKYQATIKPQPPKVAAKRTEPKEWITGTSPWVTTNSASSAWGNFVTFTTG